MTTLDEKIDIPTKASKGNFLADPVFWIYFIAVVLMAILGYALTANALKDGGWYSTLKLPSWVPPKIVFPIAWTLLFILIIIGGYWADSIAKPGMEKNLVRFFFILSLFFNVMWSFAFFYNHDIGTAVGITVALVVSIIGFIAVAPIGRYFFIPYLLWCIYALAITISVYNMNK